MRYDYFLLSLMLFANNTDAGHAKYVLPWHVDSERIIYHSCGCADSCWVAELRYRRSGKLKAAIRCDCSVLFISYPANSPERTLADSCDRINNLDNKANAIAQEFENLFKTTPSGSRPR